MDYAIITSWQAIMKVIFPSTIDGDLLKLVHLSNGLKMIPGSRPLESLGVFFARVIQSWRFSQHFSSVVASQTTRTLRDDW